VYLRPDPHQASTTTPPEVIQDILTATDRAYSAYPDSSGGRVSGLTYSEVARSPNCLFVANHVTRQLNELGYQSDELSVYFPRTVEGEERKLFHLVTAIHLPEWNDDVLIADGTWQQFLPHRRLPISRQIKEFFSQGFLPSRINWYTCRDCEDRLRCWLQ